MSCSGCNFQTINLINRQFYNMNNIIKIFYMIWEPVPQPLMAAAAPVQELQHHLFIME